MCVWRAQQVLAGAVIYVDAFLDDRSPMRDEYGRLLRNLGADVRARLPAKVATLTHLVWKDGDEGGIGTTAVSPLCEADHSSSSMGGVHKGPGHESDNFFDQACVSLHQ